ncbi:MAG: pantoate--beta-alanine ligase [Phycisphaerae bacterium]
MQLFRDIAPCRNTILESRRSGLLVGLVPTMGALHKGHQSLIRCARENCALVAVSIFVNPTQFGPKEDYEGYPRTLPQDSQLCAAEGVDLIFAPTVETMYPSGGRTSVHVSGLTDGLCGPVRPGHFDGVATVVTKLFQIIPADRAYFGEKDYQQLQVIRQLTRDLNIPIDIVACPTVRDDDGLALSSRNAYLSDSQRKQALSLSRALFTAVRQADSGEHNVEVLTAGIRAEISAAGPAEIEYVDIVDASTLERLTTIDRDARICLAVRIGACRLIDNVAVDAP